MNTQHESKASCTTLLRIAITRIPSHSLPSELESCAGVGKQTENSEWAQNKQSSPAHELLAENLELGRAQGFGE